MTDRPHVRRGQPDVRREGAVDVNAEDARVLAYVKVTAPALLAVAAHDVRFDGDARAERGAAHAIAPRDHLTGHLGPHHARRHHPRLCPRIPVVEMHVGAAHGCCRDAEQHLAGSGLRLGYIADGEAGRGSRLEDRLHSFGLWARNAGRQTSACCPLARHRLPSMIRPAARRLDREARCSKELSGRRRGRADSLSPTSASTNGTADTRCGATWTRNPATSCGASCARVSPRRDGSSTVPPRSDASKRRSPRTPRTCARGSPGRSRAFRSYSYRTCAR